MSISMSMLKGTARCRVKGALDYCPQSMLYILPLFRVPAVSLLTAVGMGGNNGRTVQTTVHWEQTNHATGSLHVHTYTSSPLNTL